MRLYRPEQIEGACRAAERAATEYRVAMAEVLSRSRVTKKVLAEMLLAKRRRRVKNVDGWVTTVFVAGARYVGTLPIDTCTSGELWPEYEKSKAPPKP